MLDFMYDVFYDGCWFCIFNVIDEVNCEVLLIEVGIFILLVCLSCVLDWLIEWYGVLDSICMDNGLEMMSYDFIDWV